MKFNIITSQRKRITSYLNQAKLYLASRLHGDLGSKPRVDVALVLSGDSRSVLHHTFEGGSTATE
jgi:hypothetical protein